MSLSSYRNEKPMYFLHLHIAGQTNCMWYSETSTKFGLHPDVLFAHACDKEDGELNVGKLQIIGIPIVEAILVPCDSREILTADMQRVLNIA